MAKGLARMENHAGAANGESKENRGGKNELL